MVQIDGFELFAGQSLLEGRELQNGAEDSCHGSVVCEGLIVKNQILQGTFLNGLQDKAVCSVLPSQQEMPECRFPGVTQGNLPCNMYIITKI